MLASPVLCAALLPADAVATVTLAMLASPVFLAAVRQRAFNDVRDDHITDCLTTEPVMITSPWLGVSRP